MAHISLLPVEYKKQKRSRRKLGISTVAMSILVGVAVFSYIIVKILSSIPESELKAVKTEHELLGKELKELEAYSRTAQDIQRLGSLARSAAEGQPDWLELFAAITGNVPEGLQITELNAVAEGDSPLVTISGKAQDHDTVAAWLEILKNEEKITEVKLKKSQYTQSESGLNSIEFEMEAVFSKDIAFGLFKEGEQ